MSTHDVTGKGRFALLTGLSGDPWAAAAEEAGRRLGVEIDVHVIGPGRDLTDLYDDWADLREVGESGCVLVRPDAHVGWRAHDLPADPGERLTEALAAILARSDVVSSSTDTSGGTP